MAEVDSGSLHSIGKEKVIFQSTDASLQRKSVRLEVVIPSSSDFFDGHFPAFKLFPAVAQIYLVERFAKKYLALEGFAKEIKRVKFPSPLLPETAVLLSLDFEPLQKEDGRGSLSFSLCDAREKDKIYSSGTALL